MPIPSPGFGDSTSWSVERGCAPRKVDYYAVVVCFSVPYKC